MVHKLQCQSLEFFYYLHTLLSKECIFLWLESTQLHFVLKQLLMISIDLILAATQLFTFSFNDPITKNRTPLLRQHTWKHYEMGMTGKILILVGIQRISGQFEELL